MKIPLFKKNLVVMMISLFRKKNAVYENSFNRRLSGSCQKGRLRLRLRNTDGKFINMAVRDLCLQPFTNSDTQYYRL